MTDGIGCSGIERVAAVIFDRAAGYKRGAIQPRSDRPITLTDMDHRSHRTVEDRVRRNWRAVLNDGDRRSR